MSMGGGGGGGDFQKMLGSMMQSRGGQSPGPGKGRGTMPRQQQGLSAPSGGLAGILAAHRGQGQRQADARSGSRSSGGASSSGGGALNDFQQRLASLKEMRAQLERGAGSNRNAYLDHQMEKNPMAMDPRTGLNRYGGRGQVDMFNSKPPDGWRAPTEEPRSSYTSSNSFYDRFR